MIYFLTNAGAKIMDLRRFRDFNPNNKIIIYNLLSSLFIKGGGLVLALFTMPAFLQYFDSQQTLGIWFTLLSVFIWLLNFDLGIGNGLRNNLVILIAKSETRKTSEYISTAYVLTGILAFLIFIVGYQITNIIDWNIFFNVDKETISADGMQKLVQIIFCGIVLNFFLRTVNVLFYALQKNAVNNLLGLITSALQLIFILVAPKWSDEEGIVLLAFFYMFFLNFPLLIATFYVFNTKLKDNKPNFKKISKEAGKDIMSLGGIFFACQIMYMLIMNTNEFFIAKYTSPDNVVQYQIYWKLFSLVGMFATISLAPIWSVVTKAIAENNFAWLQSLYNKMKKSGIIVVAIEFLIIPFLPFILKVWLGDKAIEVNYFYAVSFALFGSVFIYQSILSTIVCGIGNMKLQAVCYFIGIIIKAIIIHFGINAYNDWIVVVISNFLILLPYCILQQIVLDKYMKNVTKVSF